MKEKPKVMREEQLRNGSDSDSVAIKEECLPTKEIILQVDSQT